MTLITNNSISPFTVAQTSSVTEGLIDTFENAVASNDLETLQQIMHAHPDLTSSLDHNDLLGTAAWGGNHEVLEYLLQLGLDPNIPNEYGETAIFFANTSTSVDLLVRYHADIQAIDNEGKTALFSIDHGEGAASLIGYGISPNHLDHKGETALFSVYNVSMIEALAEGGIEMNHTNLKNQTALFHTVLFPKEIATQVKFGADINHTNSDGDSILHHIVKKDPNYPYYDILVLVYLGADIHLKNNKNETAFDTLKLNPEFDNLGSEEILMYEKFLDPKSAGSKEELLKIMMEERVSWDRALPLILSVSSLTQ